MKKVIAIVFFLTLAVLTRGQFTNNYSTSSSNTKWNYVGALGASAGFLLGDFTDTATLNLNPYAKGVPGILERTGNNFVFRNTTANRWLQFATTSYYSFSNILTESPAGTVKFGGLATGNTVANLAGNRMAFDSGKVVITTSTLSPPDSAFTIVRNTTRVFNVSATTGYTTVDQITNNGDKFFTTGAPSVVLNGNRLQLNNSSYIQGFQQMVQVNRSYPLTNDSSNIVATNDTLSAKNNDSTLYHAFSLKFTSFTNNLTTEKFYVNGAGSIFFKNSLLPNGLAGTSGQLLQSAGAGLPPVWADPGSVVSSSSQLAMMQALGSGFLTDIPGVSNLIGLVSASNMTDAQFELVPVYLYKSATITGVTWFQNTIGNYTADNNNRIGLYTYSGGTYTLVASCANDGNLWKTASSGTMGSKAFSSTYAATAGLYWVGCLYNNSAQTTAPSIARTTGTSGPTDFGFTNSGKFYASLAAQTDLPSSVAGSSLTAVTLTHAFWLY